MNAYAIIFAIYCFSNIPSLANADVFNKTTEFLCDNGEEKILRQYMCDGLNDCPDHSDERITLCGVSCKMRCSLDGKCLNQEQMCDEYNDCEDGEDEAEELCKFCPDGFVCYDDDLSCIDQNYVCDGMSDCDDDSDEVQGCTEEVDLTTLATTSATTIATTIATTTTTTTTATTTTTPTTTTTAASAPKTTTSTLKGASKRSSPFRKCKRDPRHRFCMTDILTLLAEKHLSKKLIKRCVKKPGKPLCQKWQKVLKLRREISPLDFVPKKCISKPSNKKCREFVEILAANLPQEIVDKCRKKPSSKKCRKLKVLLKVRKW